MFETEIPASLTAGDRITDFIRDVNKLMFMQVLMGVVDAQYPEIPKLRSILLPPDSFTYVSMLYRWVTN